MSITERASRAYWAYRDRLMVRSEKAWVRSMRKRRARLATRRQSSVTFYPDERVGLTVKRPEGEPGSTVRHLGNPGLCAVFWGSHGCQKARGHRGGHRCTCCHCWWLHRLLHRRLACVGRAPYYGPDTHFYGEDAA